MSENKSGLSYEENRRVRDFGHDVCILIENAGITPTAAERLAITFIQIVADALRKQSKDALPEKKEVQ